MSLNVKILLFVGLFSPFLAASVTAPNTSATTHFSGLLSDVLQTNHLNDLDISQLCDKELRSIQYGLDVKEIWAIKCKYNHVIRYSFGRWNSLPNYHDNLELKKNINFVQHVIRSTHHQNIEFQITNHAHFFCCRFFKLEIFNSCLTS